MFLFIFCFSKGGLCIKIKIRSRGVVNSREGGGGGKNCQPVYTMVCNRPYSPTLCPLPLCPAYTLCANQGRKRSHNTPLTEWKRAGIRPGTYSSGVGGCPRHTFYSGMTGMNNQKLVGTPAGSARLQQQPTGNRVTLILNHTKTWMVAYDQKIKPIC